MGKDKIICYCKNVSEAEIVDAIVDGARSLKEIQKATGACTGNQCAELNPKGVCCEADIKAILNPMGDVESSSSDCGCSCCGC